MAEQSVPPRKPRKQEPTRFDPSEFPDFWQDFAENPFPIRQDALEEYLRLRSEIRTRKTGLEADDETLVLKMDLEAVAGQIIEALIMGRTVAPGPYRAQVVDGHLEVREIS